MDIVNAAGARAAWYDRHPLNVGIDYITDSVAPHGVTVRNTYTVPLNKKAFIGGLGVGGGRVTPPTASGINYAAVYFNYGEANEVVLCIYRSFAQGEPILYQSSVNANVSINTGETVDIVTYCANTLGTMFMYGSAAITEFDI